MKMLINIPKVMYINAQHDKLFGQEIIVNAIKNGTPIKKGKWIHDMNNLYGCSECGERETMSPQKLKNFCPNCGKEMMVSE